MRRLGDYLFRCRHELEGRTGRVPGCQYQQRDTAIRIGRTVKVLFAVLQSD